LGIGDWGLGIGPNPQSPIPIYKYIYNKLKISFKINIYKDKLFLTYKRNKFPKNIIMLTQNICYKRLEVDILL